MMMQGQGSRDSTPAALREMMMQGQGRGRNASARNPAEADRDGTTNYWKDMDITNDAEFGAGGV